MSSTLERWRDRSTRTRSMICPPIPTTAMARESTAISSARTTARSGSSRTTGDGRPGSPSDSPRVFGDESSGDQVADEPPDPAAGEAGAVAELRARQRPFGVEDLDERAEVRSPNALAALPPVPPTRHQNCAPRVQTVCDELLHIRCRCQGAACRARSLWFNPLVRGLRHGALTVGLVTALTIGAVTACGGGGGEPGAAGAPHFVSDSGGVDHRYQGDFQYFVGGGVAAFDCDDDGRSELFFAGGARRRRSTTTRVRRAGRCGSLRCRRPSPT